MNVVIMGPQSSTTGTVRPRIPKFEVGLLRWADLDRETTHFLDHNFVILASIGSGTRPGFTVPVLASLP